MEPIRLPLLAAVIATALPCGAVLAGDKPMLERVTVEHSAALPIAGKATPKSRIVVTVVGYTPGTKGPVGLAVALICGGVEREIGQVAVMPNLPFAPSDPSKAQSFGFSLPDDPACREAEKVVVRLDAPLGAGRDAGIVIGRVAFE